jgi:hypothetical protein
MTDMARPGFYVRGRWYSPAYRAQAYARAEWLAAEQKCPVSVVYVPRAYAAPYTIYRPGIEYVEYANT